MTNLRQRYCKPPLTTLQKSSGPGFVISKGLAQIYDFGHFGGFPCFFSHPNLRQILLKYVFAPFSKKNIYGYFCKIWHLFSNLAAWKLLWKRKCLKNKTNIIASIKSLRLRNNNCPFLFHPPPAPPPLKNCPILFVENWYQSQKFVSFVSKVYWGGISIATLIHLEIK